MRITEDCEKCLYTNQKKKTDDEAYLEEVRSLLENRSEDDTAPYMIYLFNKAHERYFGSPASYREEKKQYNDLVLSMESDLRSIIRGSADPLAAALLMSRVGNYIDFAALTEVDVETFLGLFADLSMRNDERNVFESFVGDCSKAGNFLLLADNCGEIVLDKLLIEVLKEEFPRLDITVMVRGGEVLNDAAVEDAYYVGLNEHARIVSNGESIAGTVYKMLSEEAREAFDRADVILAKGQGNYESLLGEGRGVYHVFLCKCDHFVHRFNVPKLTGMFIRS